MFYLPSDKRTALYEAALSLIEEKKDLSAIKVIEIAGRADIGKGTVYEYFESKEQLLAEAIIYSVRQGVADFEKVINAAAGFKQSYMALLRHAFLLFSKSRVFLKYIIMNECSFSVHQAFQSVIKKKFEDVRKSYMHICKDIIDKGVEEGIIRNMPGRFELFVAFRSSIACVLAAKQGMPEFNGLTEKQIMEKSYGMFVKMLN